MSANQWVHKKYTCTYKENYTAWRDNDFFKESETYMYLGERWVTSGPYWVLFKHKSLTRNMHKIIYVNVSKSIGAPKTYLRVQRKLYYMDGQLGTQRYKKFCNRVNKIRDIYIYIGDVKRWVTSG